MAVKITILSDKMRGTSFALVNDSYTVGRSESADICVPDSTISGRHCTFEKRDEESYILRDEGSTNGTRVNGEKLEQGLDMPLNNGDLLQVGNVEMMYENSDSTTSTRETHTMTVINLDDTGTSDISSAKSAMRASIKGGNRHSVTLRDNKKHNAIIYGFIAILGLLVLGALVFMAFTMLGNKGE